MVSVIPACIVVTLALLVVNLLQFRQNQQLQKYVLQLQTQVLFLGDTQLQQHEKAEARWSLTQEQFDHLTSTLLAGEELIDARFSFLENTPPAR